ncbi:hypothetical protein B0I37DRAFT_184215 [Chaetomium sp. MPI-CAGE-AT-0009]|nr:hypothetical protein B0I37DRAFT_184215 [Chaetomium sp. MPI-CAGE-AT-0009]
MADWPQRSSSAFTIRPRDAEHHQSFPSPFLVMTGSFISPGSEWPSNPGDPLRIGDGCAVRRRCPALGCFMNQIYPSIGQSGRKPKGSAPRRRPLAAYRPPLLDDGNWVRENIIPSLYPLTGFGTESPPFSSLAPAKAPPNARIHTLHMPWRLGAGTRPSHGRTPNVLASRRVHPLCDLTRNHSLLSASPSLWDRSSRFFFLFFFSVLNPRVAWVVW